MKISNSHLEQCGARSLRRSSAGIAGDEKALRADGVKADPQCWAERSYVPPEALCEGGALVARPSQTKDRGGSRVRVVFDQTVYSFRVGPCATLAEIAGALRELAPQRLGSPVAIHLTVGSSPQRVAS
jgi:hypothetical protein